MIMTTIYFLRDNGIIMFFDELVVNGHVDRNWKEEGTKTPKGLSLDKVS